MFNGQLQPNDDVVRKLCHHPSRRSVNISLKINKKINAAKVLAITCSASAKKILGKKMGGAYMLIIFAFACVTSLDNITTRRDTIGRVNKIFMLMTLQVCASFCRLLQVFATFDIYTYFSR